MFPVRNNPFALPSPSLWETQALAGTNLPPLTKGGWGGFPSSNAPDLGWLLGAQSFAPSFGDFQRLPFTSGSVWGVVFTGTASPGPFGWDYPVGTLSAVAGAEWSLGDIFNGWNRTQFERKWGGFGGTQPGAPTTPTTPTAAKPTDKDTVDPDTLDTPAKRTSVYFNAAFDHAKDSSQPGPDEIYDKPVRNTLEAQEDGDTKGREAVLRELANVIAKWATGSNAEKRRGDFLSADEEVKGDADKLLINLLSPGDTKATNDFAEAAQEIFKHAGAFAPKGEEAKRAEPYLTAVKEMLGKQWGADAPRIIRKLYAMTQAKVRALGVPKETELTRTEITKKLTDLGYNAAETASLADQVFPQVKSNKAKRQLLDDLKKAKEEKATMTESAATKQMIAAANAILIALEITEEKEGKETPSELLSGALPVKKVGKAPKIDPDKGLQTFVERLLALRAILKPGVDAKSPEFTKAVKAYRKADGMPVGGGRRGGDPLGIR